MENYRNVKKLLKIYEDVHLLPPRALLSHKPGDRDIWLQVAGIIS